MTGDLLYWAVVLVATLLCVAAAVVLAIDFVSSHSGDVPEPHRSAIRSQLQKVTHDARD